MKAFDIIGNKVEFTPEFLAVKEFKKIWESDKTKNKEKAISLLSFIVFLCDERPTNPYTGYSEVLREEILKQEFFGSSEYELPEDIEKAIKKFKELNETTSMRLLVSAKVAADKLAGWFKKVDFEEYDSYGKQKYSASELSRTVKDVGNILKSLKELERQVRLEQLDDTKVRGGSEIGAFELDDEDFVEDDV